MSDKLGKMMEDIGNLQLTANVEKTVSFVVGYNSERDTLSCVDVPASALNEDTELVMERLKSLPKIDKSAGLNDLAAAHTAPTVPKITIDSLPHVDELDYATLVTPEMESKLYSHQIEMLKRLAKGKNTVVTTPKTVDSMLILNNQKHALHAMITVPKDRPKKYENHLYMSYEQNEVSVMELFSKHTGKWKEPTHVRTENGVTTHYYLLLPTMLSVQIALLCGFELKQSIERVTHINNKLQ